MYHIIDYSTDSKIIGNEFPQIQEMKPGYDYDASNSISKLGQQSNSLPSFLPELDGFLLHKKGKKTDFISSVFSSTNGIIISDRIKALFGKHTLPAHAFYAIKIYQDNDIITNYFWLQIASDNTEIINYTASSFFISRDYAHDLGEISIQSKQDYLSKKQAIKESNPNHTITIWAKQICLVSQPIEDLFTIGLFDDNLYISNRLADSLFNSNASGLNIQPSPISNC